MKHDTRCPKCESEIIGHFPKITQTTQFESSEGTPVRSEILQVELYVCGNCGYLEPYLAMSFEEVANQKIAFSWLRAPPQDSDEPYR